jgi:hypothetical protein
VTVIICILPLNASASGKALQDPASQVRIFSVTGTPWLVASTTACMICSASTASHHQPICSLVLAGQPMLMSMIRATGNV